MSFKEHPFSVFLFSDKSEKRKKYAKLITQYFERAQIQEVEKLEDFDLESASVGRSLLIVDSTSLPVNCEHLLNPFVNKVPILWLTYDEDAEIALDLLDRGKINSICYSETPSRLYSSIIRELKGALVYSQIEVLGEQNTLLSDISENTKTVVITTDENGITLWANQAHENLTGYTLDEMIGNKPGAILQGPETDPETIRYFSEKLKEQIPFSVEILNYKKSGEKLWTKINVTPIFKDGRINKYISFQEDITDKKLNEKKLAESFIRLNDAQRIGKMCDWMYYPDAKEISWSERAHEIIELDDISNFNYWNLRKQLTRTSFKKLQQSLQEIRTSNQEFDINLEFKSRSKSIKILRAVGIPIISNNRLISVHGILQDISEQYKAEALASESLEHLQSVTDNLLAGVCRVLDKVDGSREVIFANQGFFDMYELTEEQVHEDFTNVMKLLHPDDKVLNINEIFEEVQRTKQAVDQYFRIITHSGKLRWMHLISNASALPNGDILHDFIVTDITEKVLSDRLFQEISEVSLSGGWELDMLANKLTWTDVTKQIHEVPEDFEPDVQTAINFYKEGESRDRITEFFTEVITTGNSRDGQFEIVTAKGNLKWVRAKGAAEYAGDQIVRVYGFFQDITESVKRQRTIVESLNEKNALLGEIHHRVKNNLAVISGLLQLQLMKGENAQLSLEDAVNRIQSIATVHEILYNTENFNVINLDKYLEKLTLNIAKTNPSFISDIKLNSNIEEVDLSINQAVPVGLLLNELITNSLKHAFKNEDPGSISINVTNSGNNSIQLSYSDSGTGFDKSLLDQGESLGYKLIQSLLLQLEATHTIETIAGFKLDCTFKIENEPILSRLTEE